MANKPPAANCSAASTMNGAPSIASPPDSPVNRGERGGPAHIGLPKHKLDRASWVASQSIPRSHCACGGATRSLAALKSHPAMWTPLNAVHVHFGCQCSAHQPPVASAQFSQHPAQPSHAWLHGRIFVRSPLRSGLMAALVEQDRTTNAQRGRRGWYGAWRHWEIQSTCLAAVIDVLGLTHRWHVTDQLGLRAANSVRMRASRRYRPSQKNAAM